MLDHYLAQIQQFCPNLAITSATLNTEGLVNDVIIVNKTQIFRFPKHEWAFADMQQEAKALALAARHVTLPLPQWILYADRFVGYERIPGEALQRYFIQEANEITQNALAEQLGLFLLQLHTIPLHEVAAAGIGPSVTNRDHTRWLTLYEDVQRELFPYLMRFQQDWVHHHFAPIVEDEAFMQGAYCFINGDLGAYHLLYDRARQRVNGIIDFGTAGIGDPATDFACLLDQYGEAFVQRLRSYYPGLAALLPRARFWAGTMELQWALGGLRNPDDPSWYFVHLGRARDIGGLPR